MKIREPNKEYHTDIQIHGKDHVLDTIGELIEYTSYLTRAYIEAKDDPKLLNELYKFVVENKKEFEEFLNQYVDKLENKTLESMKW